MNKIKNLVKKIRSLKKALFPDYSQKPLIILVAFGLLILTPLIGIRVVALSSSQEVVQFCKRLVGENDIKEMACTVGVQNGASECLKSFPQNDGSGEYDSCKKGADAEKNNQIDKYGPVVTSSETAGGTSGGTTSGSTSGTTGGPSGGTGGGTTSGSTSGTTSQGTEGSEWEEIIKELTKQVQNNLDGLNRAIDAVQKLQEALDKTQVDKGCNKASSDIATIRKFYINGACGEQPIYELRPAPAPNSPVILFFNGGAWLSNDCSGEHVTNTLAMNPNCGGGFYQLGAEAIYNTALTGRFAVYDVSYRYGTSGVYYQLEDVLRAIKHFRENAGALGIDPGKIIIWGDSAGGSLVMRAAATGASGARVAVGWSAPTNGYTAIFRSFQSLGVGMAHTTCIPTDLSGIANLADLATGGDGTVAEYDGSISTNGFSNLTSPKAPFALLSELVDGAGYVASIAGDIETLSQQIINQDFQGLAVGAINLTANKFVECIENFNAMSPALFASPDTPPSFLAGFDNDGVVGPEQAYGMRDKLQQLGIKSEALIRPGDGDCANKTSGPAFSGGCHLGYYWSFVCPSIRFIDSVLQPENQANCETGYVPR